MGFVDRLLTIVVTATLTSAAWIVFGSTYIDGGGEPSPMPLPTSSVAQAPRASAASTAPVAATGPLLIPVAGIAASQLSDTFNQARGGERRHEALDIMAPAGTPVLAAAGGRLEKLFKSDAGGNTVYVRSPDGTMLYYYAHLQAYAPGLKEGAAVARGQPLGTVGSTGNADPAGPHLHFAVMRTTPDAEWWKPATPVNPYPMLVREP